MLKKIRTYFITGLIIILPIIVSIYLFTFLFVKLTDYIFNLFPEIYLTKFQFKILLRLIALGLLIAVIILLGMFGRNVIGRKLLYFGESILLKIPLLGRVYIAVKQVSEAFLGYDKNILNQVCLIEYPRKGLHSIGFITSKTIGEIQYRTQKSVVNVFIPTTPNPTSGIFIMVSEKEVIPLQMTIEEGLKLVISGGAVVPKFNPKNDKHPSLKEIK
ncbi:DUF502 domain-containing protein [bacterium]|nr:DUF502 domain-containing protein [bacterium]